MSLYVIKTGLIKWLELMPEFADRVFVEHERVLTGAELPCLVIRFEGASADSPGASYVTWTYQFSVSVYVRASAADAPEDAAENLLDAVMHRLYARPLINDFGDAARFSAISAEFDTAGEEVVRRLTLELAIQESETIGADASGLDDFKRAHVDFDLASPRNDPPRPTHPDGQIDASAIINLPPPEGGDFKPENVSHEN
ncbi:MAG: hypothetical protein LBD67_06395 [Candidatus Accumulibacter sp.]|jgi:hypothetical protein|nr:hypothetical protein [Accumulibacter sp.]